MTEPTLAQRITYLCNLMHSARHNMHSARHNGDTQAEQTYTRRMNDLLERVPRPARF